MKTPLFFLSSIILGSLSSYLFLLFLHPDFAGPAYFFYSVLCLVVFLALMFIYVSAEEFWTLSLLFITLSYLSIAGILYYYYPSNLLILAWLTCLILTFWNYFSWRRFMKNSLTLSFIQGEKVFLRGVIFYLAIFLVAVYSLSVKPKLEISNGAWRYAIYPVTPIVKIFLPDFSLTQSIETILRSVAKKYVSDPVSENFFVEDAKTRILKNLNLNIDFNETLDSTGLKIANGFLKNLSPDLRNIISLGFASLILTFILSGSYFISIVVGGVAWLIYQLLIFAGIFKIAKKEAEQEMIMF